ncbi:hypothetical protein CEE35_06955 [Candidatus Aerophobetes bacterium Ae_b3b]|nr:MAG: hypothetical protein CEE35_06955 [Candidatus Aerophobetes bacterium Ae_b3b]
MWGLGKCLLKLYYGKPLIVPVFRNCEAGTAYLYLHPRKILKSSAHSIFYYHIIIKEICCIIVMI